MRTMTTAAATLALIATGAGLAGTAVATTTDACSGVSACTIVSTADVDGDGARDSVGMTRTRWADGRGTATIRVRTADGERLQTTTRINRYLDDQFHGAARMDGEPGHELVLTADMGAHTPWFRAITYRDGALETLVDPHHELRWTLDSAVWVGKSYKRSTTSTGAVKMTAYTAVRDNGGDTFEQTGRSVRWSNGRWSKLGQTTRQVSSAEAYRYADWFVPYLPKFYR